MGKENVKLEKRNLYKAYFNNLYIDYNKIYNHEYTAINVQNYLNTIDLIELNKILSYMHKNLTLNDVNWIIRQELFLRGYTL